MPAKECVKKSPGQWGTHQKSQRGQTQVKTKEKKGEHRVRYKNGEKGVSKLAGVAGGINEPRTHVSQKPKKEKYLRRRARGRRGEAQKKNGMT